MEARKTAILVTPLAAMITLAAGLRIGASDATRAAIVYGAPPAKGSNRLAWQIATFGEHLGVREAIAVPDLLVVATHGETRAEWRGKSNEDGIAEAALEVPGVRAGDDVWLDVHAGDALLAHGRAEWGATRVDEPRAAWARASRKEGPLIVDVAPLGAKLAAGFPGSLWVRVTERASGKPLGGVAIDVEPEPGLDVGAAHVVTCAAGWAQIVATPTYHVVGMSLHAKKGDLEGLWYGGVPVAGAASNVALPLRIEPGEARAVEITAPGARGAIYAEVDDAEGRAFAQVLAAPKATLNLPPLAPGLYWIVTANEPHGAETLAGGALARPVLASSQASTPCETGARLAESSIAGFPRAVALDGFAGRRDAGRARHRLGVAIGLAGLAVAAALEGLLVLTSARRANKELPASLTRRTPAGSIAIGLLAALLGFALLAALLLYRST